MNKDIIKRYSNGDITVVWQPSLCVHSAICARGLPESQTIVDQVERCPSGALSIERTTPEPDK